MPVSESSAAADAQSSEGLRRELGLFDVFAISTGAMFSSGFFLLPGIAAAQTGPSVMVAYLLASLIMIPPMLSMAELSTAMPRSGGNYYFLDRSLGPLVGTVGGFGEWLVLVLKSAFALIGMGAYLGIFFQVPIVPVAIALTLAFTALNVVGTRESSSLQRGLVAALVLIMSFFIVQGLWAVGTEGFAQVHRRQFDPFLLTGIGGLFATVGMVFVSYSGLTKVASVAEEIRDPDRTIPLGMILSLSVTTVIYVAGVYVMTAVLPAGEFREDLTPVATAGEAFMGWLPGGAAVVLLVVAAIAAFASTGNAGILSASRFPLAMARDRLIWRGFARIGDADTPRTAILVTGGLIVTAIITLDVESVAKLASSFQLLTFGLINLALIVMRESRIPGYQPGFRAPLYPWLPLAGVVTAGALIYLTGIDSFLFTVGLVAAAVAWYFVYARDKVDRRPAVFHVFARLGAERSPGLDSELRDIMKERTPEERDRFEATVARARVVELSDGATFEDTVEEAATELARDLPLSSERLVELFLEGRHIGATPIFSGTALPNIRIPEADETLVVLARSSTGIDVELDEDSDLTLWPDRRVYAFIFLVSPQARTGQHLRILAELVARADETHFIREWCQADDESALREVLLRHERYLALRLRDEGPTAGLVGTPVRDLSLPDGTLIALVSRGERTFPARGDTVLRAGDRITLVGEPEEIRATWERYRRSS